jgi:hypothetical protein
MSRVQSPLPAPMKRYGFNVVPDDKKRLRSLVRWCRMMKKEHPHYDLIDLMIWAYEKGRTDVEGKK